MAEKEYSKIEVARFWSNVEVGNPSQCWNWRGYVTDFGHGRISGVHAHRIAYELFFGAVDGLVIRHTCDNPACCNPTHLIAGSHADNVGDRVARNRSAIGIKNGRTKLSEDQVIDIYLSPEPSAKVAKHYGVDRNCVIQIRNRTTWKHVTAALADKKVAA